MLSVYIPASTANPTGRRPWNSRLAFYEQNSFAVPTSGQGPYLLNPGVTGAPAANGGMGFYQRASYPLPTSSMSGMGQTDTQILGTPVDPNLLFLGLGVLALGIFLLGGRTVPRARRGLARRIAGTARRVGEVY